MAITITNPPNLVDIGGDGGAEFELTGTFPLNGLLRVTLGGVPTHGGISAPIEGSGLAGTGYFCRSTDGTSLRFVTPRLPPGPCDLVVEDYGYTTLNPPPSLDPGFPPSGTPPIDSATVVNACQVHRRTKWTSIYELRASFPAETWEAGPPTIQRDRP